MIFLSFVCAPLNWLLFEKFFLKCTVVLYIQTNCIYPRPPRKFHDVLFFVHKNNLLFSFIHSAVEGEARANCFFFFFFVFVRSFSCFVIFLFMYPLIILLLYIAKMRVSNVFFSPFLFCARFHCFFMNLLFFDGIILYTTVVCIYTLLYRASACSWWMTSSREEQLSERRLPSSIRRERYQPVLSSR